ncbi:Heavy-metal resistance [Desulfonatronum thiosulfatophilum]|uniref:Heavy-metal resistance n=1 Tax=Desulfonatronum thiosulfatophilum TaxID=617002 RepID=A0A1G6BDT0_9BACT|nr:periplasmic heavy metal sensor [Desulfonatronum thiosulfatophilum]SDB18743.1 Heavy-metal resistance [Desulfonatronum thiosulfatophilum]
MQKLFTISALLLALSLLSAPVLAQHQHGAQDQETQAMDAHPVLGDLSEEQREALKNMIESHRQEVMHHNLRMRAKQAELDVLLASPEANQDGINVVTQEITQLYGDILRVNNNLRRGVFEETGHLIPSGALGGKGQGMGGQGMGGRGMMSGKGRMMNCPMMQGHSDD